VTRIPVPKASLNAQLQMIESEGAPLSSEFVSKSDDSGNIRSGRQAKTNQQYCYKKADCCLSRRTNRLQWYALRRLSAAGESTANAHRAFVAKFMAAKVFPTLSGLRNTQLCLTPSLCCCTQRSLILFEQALWQVIQTFLLFVAFINGIN
jgi:hypothetical protein